MSKKEFKLGKKSRKIGKAGKKHRKLRIVLIVISGILILGLIAVLIWKFAFKPEAEELTEDNQSQVEPVRHFSPLTGIEISDPELANRTVFAVIIGNSVEARPQSGLKEAGVVFEAVSEGGITRFIALYQESEPELIGPVRSVRPYYLDWAAAFDPAVAHVGGSDEALAMVRSGSHGVSLDEFFHASTYWRAADRWAPHNTYTNFTRLTALSEVLNKTTSNFEGWARQDGEIQDCECYNYETVACECEMLISRIDIAISVGAFAVSYSYDESTNTFLRSHGNVPHIDREKGQIAPNVVVAMRVNQSIAPGGLHNQIQTIGSGEVYIFQNGRVQRGRWQKDGARSQLRFLDEDGEDIKLNRGQTWVTAVPQGMSVSWQ